MENINSEDIEPEYPPENVLVFHKGCDLADALHTFLLQPGGYELLIWLVTRLIDSRDLDKWLEDFQDTVKENPELAQTIHAFFRLIVHLIDGQEDIDRFSAIQKAVQRRIATGLYRKLETESEVRLLKITPSSGGDIDNENKSDALLLCSLETRSLGDKDLHFDALSYVWGDATHLMPILVDNKLFLVTRNLFEALHSFRKNKVVSGFLWIDAICINQQDVNERNHQVTLMRQLYSQAKKVRIWVGPESEHTGVLFDRLEDCGGEQNRPRASIGNAMGLVDIESGCLYGLLDLLAREWWSRLWVVQEFALAQDPVIHCGSHVFDFGRLQEILVTLTTLISDLPKDSLVYRAISDSDLGRIQRLCMLLWESMRHGAASTTNILDGTTHCTSTIQHDRIYALLGLLPSTLIITPQYEAKVEDAFESAALSILKSAGFLDLLRITALTENRKLELPSWVPEFGNTVPAHYMYRFSAHFKADLDATCFIHQERHGELRVRALIFDEIRVCSDPLDRDFPRSSPLELLREKLKMWRTLLHSVSGDIAIDLLTFWQTVTTNRLINLGSGAQRWDEDDKLCLTGRWESWLFDHTEKLDGEPLEHLLSSVWEAHGQSSFFVSTTGRLGLGDAAPIQEGDKIAILAGSKDPAILRPVPDRDPQGYMFVQNCYCHGE